MINISYAVKLTGNVLAKEAFSLSGNLRSSQAFTLSGQLLCSTVDRQSIPYAGPYVVTPNLSTQTLLTENMRLTGNVVVNPIPPNYGLITWNGSFLKVS